MLSKSCFICVVISAFLLIAAMPTRAGQLTNAEPHFTITIPDDFRRDTDLMAQHSDFLYAFRKAETGSIGQLIIIQRLKSTIGRERLNASQLPAGFAGRLFTMEWNGFDLDALEVPEQTGTIQAITYNVQIPLKPQAIQLRVVGRREQKDELLRITKNLLAGLSGESNWLGSVAPGALSGSANYGQILLLACAAFIILGLVGLWIVRQKSGRGGVLVLATFAYLASWALGPGEVRETRAAVGALRMLGFLGIVGGFLDLFRFGGKKTTPEHLEVPPLPPLPHDQKSQSMLDS